MADPNNITKSDRVSRNEEFSLNYAFDAGFIPGPHPPDSPNNRDYSEFSQSSDSASSGSKRTSDLAASLRVFSEAMLRMEMAELEMVKAREASRLAAENRRLETEAELTQLILKTQLQIASVITRTWTSRKRKRSDEDDSSASQREGAMLLSLLQCNLLI